MRLSSTALGALIFAMGTAASAQETYDWSGFYVGVMGSGSVGNNGVSVDYNTDPEGVGVWFETSDSEIAYWGEMHDFVSDISLDGGSSNSYGLIPTPEDLVDPWLTSLMSNPTGLSYGGYAGWMWQKDSFVGGLELQGSMSDWGDSYFRSWVQLSGASGEITGYDGGGVNIFELNGLGKPVWNWTNNDDPDGGYDSWGDNNDGYDYEDVSYDANVRQLNSLSYDFNTDWVFSPVVRGGVAAERMQVFGFVGPTVASVSSATLATVTERASGTADSSRDMYEDDNDILLVESIDNYQDEESAVLDDLGGYEANWSGENQEVLYGYKIGAGVEYAMTDNMIVRLVGEFSNLGTASVIGTSLEGDTGYTVQNSISNYSMTSGLSLKFN